MDNYKSRRRKYKSQKNYAKQRSISWGFTYVTWWRKWCESGKWDKRGHHKDEYVMARFKDKGPYSPSNTRIITVQENLSEAWTISSYRNKITEASRQANIGNTNRRGKPWTKNQRTKLTGLKRSEETKQKISKSKLGYTASPAARQKQSRSLKEFWRKRKAQGRFGRLGT